MSKNKTTPEPSFQERIANIERKVNQLLITQKTMLSVKEATEYMDISRQHLYQLCSQGYIRYYKPSGKRTYFRREDLDKFLMSNK